MPEEEIITNEQIKQLATELPYSYDDISWFILKLKFKHRNINFIRNIYQVAISANISPESLLPILI